MSLSLSGSRKPLYANSNCLFSLHSHSTGRGGLANLTEKHTPGVEGVPYQSNANEGDYVSQGRGGAGNIRARSRSKEPNHHGGVLSGLADKVHNMHLGHRHSEDSTIKE